MLRHRFHFMFLIAICLVAAISKGTVDIAAGEDSKPDVSACDCAARTQFPSDKTPILLVTDSSYKANPFGCYLVEILRSEGLVEFEQVERTELGLATDTQLSDYQVIILAEMKLTDVNKKLLRRYVHDGGLLIGMRPGAGLADLFGVKIEGIRTERLLQYFGVAAELSKNLPLPSGMGIVQKSLQYHGEATNYLPDGAKPLAFLYDDVDTVSKNTAVTVNRHGRGLAVAFAFDLAKSVTLMRQGNPDWKDSEGDGITQYRPMDMFYRLHTDNLKTTGVDTSMHRSKEDLFRDDGRKYTDFKRLRIPQADESQRLLANLIVSLADKPLPRMWYLPKTHKTLMVNTGDAENNFGEELDPAFNDCAKYGGFFTAYLRNGGPGRGVERTTVEKEAAWRKAGHEIGVHPWSGAKEYIADCEPYDKTYATIVQQMKDKFGHGSRTGRPHTGDWVGWTEMAAIMAKYGTRMDLTYYHYYNSAHPLDSYGYFNGTGLPQRFIDANGKLLPIYQTTTQWADEWFADNKLTVEQTVSIIKTMFEDAEKYGYYSAFVNNIHQIRYNGLPGIDEITEKWPSIIWQYCRDKDIPSWSAEMLLDFVEARNSVRFEKLSWKTDPARHTAELSFDFMAPLARQDLTVMLPVDWSGRKLKSLLVNGKPTEFQTEQIKGIEYGMFTIRKTKINIVATYTKP
ncbi:MAG: hypothetical protein JXM70_22275 [Pirellulales bacterium]|nr:hypothetical protein [Pirellulales bacterium]